MQKLLKKFWSNSFFRGGVFYTTSSLLTNIMNYVFNVTAGRSLGPSGYGQLSALFSYMTVTTVPLVIISNFIIHKIAGTEKKVVLAKSLERWLWDFLKRWSLVILLSFVLTPVISNITNLSYFLSFTLVLSVILSIVYSFYSSFLQGMQLFFIYSVMGALSTFVKLLGAFTVLPGMDRLVTIVCFITASTILGIIICLRAFHNAARVDSSQIQTIPVIGNKITQIVQNQQFQLISLSLFALTIFSNADVMFVQKYFAPFEVGIYSSWSLFAKIIFYALGPLISISFIFFSSKQSINMERKTLHVSLGALLIVGICSYLAYNYLTLPVIHFFFGNKFIAVAPYLTKASLFGTLYSGIIFINNFFLAKKSRISSIAFFSMFVYIFFLFFVKRDIGAVMDLNIIFSAALFITYVVLYVKFFLLNKKTV